MVECVCPKCKAKLRIDENDAIPGCREFEEVYCPVCQAEVTTSIKRRNGYEKQNIQKLLLCGYGSRDGAIFELCGVCNIYQWT